MSQFHKTKRGQIILGDSLGCMSNRKTKTGNVVTAPIDFSTDEVSLRRVRCECQKPGALYSGVKGILAGPPDKLGRRCIERCDACELFNSDAAAGLEYARIEGGGCRYDERERILWTPA